MSSNDANLETYNSIKEEISRVKEECKVSYSIISNNPSDLSSITAENKFDKMLCYVDGLRVDIEKSETTICTDDNLLTLRYVNMLKDRVQKLEHLVAYKRGLLAEIDGETSRLKSLLNSYKKARSQTSSVNTVTKEHVLKAKAHFKVMRSGIYKVVQALFKNSADDVLYMLTDLIQYHTNKSSDGYMVLKPEQFHIAEMLKDSNLITRNPYNKDQVKICLD